MEKPWIRNTQVIKDDDWNYPKFLTFGKPYSVCRLLPYVTVFSILFCGKVYRMIKVGDRFYYKYEELFKDASAGEFFELSGFSYKNWLKDRASGKSYYPFSNFNLASAKSLDDKLESYNLNKSSFNKVHIDTGSPLVVAVKGSYKDYHEAMHGFFYVINPSAKEIGLHKLFDSQAASQEIEMFFGSVLSDVKESPSPMTDDLKIHSHGFDKNSFRNISPGNKKRKRKKQK